jgi:hypothetical protein
MVRLKHEGGCLTVKCEMDIGTRSHRCQGSLKRRCYWHCSKRRHYFNSFKGHCHSLGMFLFLVSGETLETNRFSKLQSSSFRKIISFPARSVTEEFEPTDTEQLFDLAEP